jgi:DNA-binding transcriptional ArsR family regulator
MIAGGAQPGGNPAAMSDDVKSLSVRYEAQAVTIRTLSAKLKKYEDAEAKARKKAADDKRAALDADVDSLVTTGVVLKADSDKLRALAHRDEVAYRDMVAVLRNRPAVPTGVEAAGRKVEAGGDQSLDVFVDMSQPAIKSLSDSLKRFGLTDEVVAKRIREHVARAPKVSAG